MSFTSESFLYVLVAILAITLMIVILYPKHCNNVCNAPETFNKDANSGSNNLQTLDKWRNGSSAYKIITLKEGVDFTLPKTETGGLMLTKSVKAKKVKDEYQDIKTSTIKRKIYLCTGLERDLRVFCHTKDLKLTGDRIDNIITKDDYRLYAKHGDIINENELSVLILPKRIPFQNASLGILGSKK